jgi:hypothetical protein
LSCASALPALAMKAEIRRGIRIRRGVIGALYRASLSWKQRLRITATVAIA